MILLELVRDASDAVHVCGGEGGGCKTVSAVVIQLAFCYIT